MFSFRWLRDKSEYDLALLEHLQKMRSIDGWIAELQAFNGYCNICDALTTFQVFGGAYFGNAPNLREGMVCPTCQLSNRQRLVLGVAQNIWRHPDAVLLLHERFTALYGALAKRYRNLNGCEYVGRGRPLGKNVDIRGIPVRNEDATALTFHDA